MRDLSTYSNVYTNYLKTGVQPRTLVRIPSLDTDLTTTLKSTGTISRTAKPFGGFEQAATLSISNLILNDDVKFCTESTLTPTLQTSGGILRGAGKAIKDGLTLGTYATTRNATAGVISDPTLTVGQRYNPAMWTYSGYRSFLQFTIPTGMTSCEEATLYLRGISKYSLVNFQIMVLAGTWTSLGTGLVYDTGLYNDFTGWVSSGVYTVAQYNETFSTSEFFTYSATLPENEQHVMIRFSAAGLSAILAKTGAIFRIMLVSQNDALNTAPTADEFVIFDATNAELRLRYNAISLDNAPVYVYRYYGDTQPAYSSMLELFRGVISGYTINLRTMDIAIRKDEGTLEKKIPETLFLESEYESLTVPGISENIGELTPMVYGNFTVERSFIDSICSFREEINGVRCESADFFKALLCHKNSTHRFYIFSSFALKSLTEFVAIYNSALDSFVMMPCTFSTSGGLLITAIGSNCFPYNLTTEEYGHPSWGAVMLKKIYTDQSSGMLDELNSQDDDPTNWCIINNLFDTWNGSNYDQWGQSGFTTLAFSVDTYAPSGYDTNHINFRYDILRLDGSTLYSHTEEIDTDGIHIYYKTDSGIPTSNINVLISISANAEFKSAYPIWFRNIFVARGFEVNLGNEVYMTGTGRPDDGSGTVTGTAALLIEKPPHVIESLARSEFDLSTARIDTADFDSAAVDLTNWKLAFQLLDAESGIKLFDRIGEQCKASIFRNETDQLSIKIWDDTDFFSHSGTDIPGDLDIFQTSQAAATTSGIEYVTRNPIALESLTLDKTDIDKVYSSFELKYRINYATGNYLDILTMDDGVGVVSSITTTLVAGDEAYMENSQTIAGLKALCAASYTNCANTTHKLTIEADLIRDRATAVKLLQHNIEVYTARRYTVELSTWENALPLEYGDIVNIRHQRINERFGIPTAYRKKWAFYGVKHTLRNGEMRLKFIEVDPAR